MLKKQNSGEGSYTLRFEKVPGRQSSHVGTNVGDGVSRTAIKSVGNESKGTAIIKTKLIEGKGVYYRFGQHVTGARTVTAQRNATK